MSEAMKPVSYDGTGVTYAAPSDPDQTYRFKTTTRNKTMGGKPVKNLATEIIFNDNFSVTTGGLVQVEALSARLRVSGSALASSQKREIVKSLAAALSKWADEGVFDGFQPTTAPVKVGA